MNFGTYISLLVITPTLLFPSIFQGQGMDSVVNYFPLQVGNTWNYTSWWDTSIALTDQVTDTVSLGGIHYYVFSRGINFASPSSDTIRSDDRGRIWTYRDGTEDLLYDFTLDGGQHYQYPVKLWYGWDTLNVGVFREEDTTLGIYFAGFLDCVAFIFDLPAVLDEEDALTFTRDVGLISFVNLNHTYGYFFHSASIGGEIVTGLRNRGEIGGTYLLRQNYPNPFNPSTEITYSLPSAGSVTLKIFDILGREVATLVNGRRTEGTHRVEWNPDGNPGGVYLYRIVSGDFTQTKKMVLMK